MGLPWAPMAHSVMPVMNRFLTLLALCLVLIVVFIAAT